MYRKLQAIVLVIGLMATMIPVPPAIQAAAAVDSPAVVTAFKDVQNHWAKEAAAKLAGEGLLYGYEDGLFHPDAAITRAELVALLNRVFQYADTGTAVFTDVSASAWYADALAKGAQARIVTGYADGSFNPGSSVQRQDSFLMLSRAFRLEQMPEAVLSTFPDQDQLSGYARAAAGTMAVNGYISGDANSQLKPQGTLTRAEAAVMISRMIGWVSADSGRFAPGEVKGNAVVNRSGVELQNTRISGALYVTEGVGNGEFTAEHIAITGNTWITGGGVNSVILKGSELADITVDKKSSPVRLLLSEGTTASGVKVKHPAVIELTADSAVAKLTIEASAAGTTLINKGTIAELEVDAEGVLLNGEPLAKGTRLQLPASPAVSTAPTSVPAVVNGGTGSGGSESPSTAAPTAASTPEPTPASTTAPTPAPTAVATEPPVQADPWKLVWNDEFNSNVIDTTKWNIEDTGTVYNNELEYYRPDNAAIEEESGNSVLALEARSEAYEGRDYTSAKLTSKLKGDFTYGKFSVRAKLPIQQGMWPAIWMMPTDEFHQYGPWPGSGEMDIMELTGPKASDPENADKYPRTVHGSLHYNLPHEVQTEEYVLPEGQTFADEYHEYTLEWLPGLIRYYVDGEKYFETSDWGTQALGQPDFYTYPAPFDRPFYMILNLAVGGDWPGDPLSDFVSDKMFVDYVRVYEYADLENWPDVTGQRPENSGSSEPQRPALPDGNQIYNGAFAEGVDSTGLPQNWQFIENEGGQGSVSVMEDPEKGSVSKVTVDDKGTVNYSLQLTQMPLLLEKGKSYKATFEAKGDVSRPFMSKLTQFGGAWKAYSGEQNLQLSEQWQTYEYCFTMKDPSDNNVRFEFNLGQNAGAAYFTNVSVVEIDPIVEERTALADGNWIYNGNFDLGKDRMEFWQISAVPEAGVKAGVTNTLAFPQMERWFRAEVSQDGLEPDAVKLLQEGLPLTPGGTYQLTFDAKASKELVLQVAMDTAAEQGGYPDGAEMNLTTEAASFSKRIQLSDTAAAHSTLSFLLGSHAGEVQIDNVRLVQIKSPASSGGYIHLQADHYDAAAGTELVPSAEGVRDLAVLDEGDYADYKVKITQGGSYVPMLRAASILPDSELAVTLLDESRQPVVTAVTYGQPVGNTGGLNVYRTLTSEPLSLTAGTYYIRISGQGYHLTWLDLTREMAADGRFESGSAEAWTLFKKDWVDTDPVKDTVASVVYGELKVSLGGTGDEPWNAQVKQSGIPLEKGRTYQLSFNAHSSMARSILALVQHDGATDNNWTTYLEQPAVLGEEDAYYEYRFTANGNEPASVLQFSLGRIDEVLGAHDVYLDNISLVQINPVLAGQPYEGELLPNGDFAAGIQGWTTYTADNGQLAISAAEEKLKIDLGTAGSNSWDRQVYYEGIEYTEGNRYTLTFKAKSSTARKMNISIGWLDAANNYTWHSYTSDVVDLGGDEQLYTIGFNVESVGTSIGRISFELGNIDGEAAGSLTVHIDNISLIDNGAI
ncbi:carbohydrate binding domain-containing protein [Paenibacillus donghaensis]|uniref:Licheninase n=1 Tax=Paenibacillus donghaensis TaxID=414771 RepID=A0A2Z2KHU9_9BACL|nr:carbohydrate binding domain-containing protein [Paenibacillus donghaensis]ASA23665.1 hypothetical protein B9T62_24450 [Paenibacillus donghaensis]